MRVLVNLPKESNWAREFVLARGGGQGGSAVAEEGMH